MISPPAAGSAPHGVRGARGPGRGGAAPDPGPPVRRVALVLAPEPARDRLSRELLRVGPGHRRPRHRQDGDRAARAAFLAERAGQPRLPRPVLLTTFNGNLAESLHAQLDLLVPDAAVRDRIEVLNVDRLAYRVVKQARVRRSSPTSGTAVRWAQAAAGRPRPHPGVPEERVGAGHPGPGPARRTGLPDLPAHRPGAPALQGAAQPGLAGCPRVTNELAAAGSPPTSSWPTRPPSCSASRERRATGTSWWTRPRTCTGPVAAAPRGRRSRPRRPVHRGRPAPAHLRQPGRPRRPADQRPGADRRCR